MKHQWSKALDVPSVPHCVKCKGSMLTTSNPCDGWRSPCQCGKFEPKQSMFGWNAGSIERGEAYTQTVCANCGCHEPRLGEK